MTAAGEKIEELGRQIENLRKERDAMANRITRTTDRHDRRYLELKVMDADRKLSTLMRDKRYAQDDERVRRAAEGRTDETDIDAGSR